MFALELAFDDNPARLELRPAHRARLGALAADGQLLAAGPWGDESGALLVFDVPTREDAERLVAEDPYCAAPGVTVVALREWNAVTLSPKLA